MLNTFVVSKDNRMISYDERGHDPSVQRMNRISSHGVVESKGKFVLGENGELMIELKDQETAKTLSAELKVHFGDKVFITS